MTENQIQTVADLMRQAEAILVGAGSGLSSAAGYNHYHHDQIFQTHFGDFENAYGIQNVFQGFYYLYSKPEQQWGFYARYMILWKKHQRVNQGKYKASEHLHGRCLAIFDELSHFMQELRRNFCETKGKNNDFESGC